MSHYNRILMHIYDVILIYRIFIHVHDVILLYYIFYIVMWCHINILHSNVTSYICINIIYSNMTSYMCLDILYRYSSIYEFWLPLWYLQTFRLSFWHFKIHVHLKYLIQRENFNRQCRHNVDQLTLLYTIFIQIRTKNIMTKRTNNDLQNTTQKTKDRETWTPLRIGVNSFAPEW
jgi:hypothetical protein